MRRRVVLAGTTTSLMVLGALTSSAWAGGPRHAGCTPVPADVPVCPAAAPEDTASFLDPTALVLGGQHIGLGERVYVGPFAELVAGPAAPVSIGADSNAQDNVLVVGSHELAEQHGVGGAHELTEPAPDGSGGRQAAAGVVIGERVILAHGVSVIGPASIGVGGGDIPADPDDDQEVFLSFGAQVDGAVLEQNTGVSALGRVGPGVTLPSGMLVLPGKNVTTDEEASDPGLGKVREINEADVAFNEAVIEVNAAFAREYTRLHRESPDAVRGVGVDPGHTEFNPDRDLPSFAGQEQAVPGFRNRVIGDVDLADRFGQFDRAAGDRISLRADEGEPFVVGHVDSMGDDVVFHALEDTDLHVGDGVRYGEGTIVHGGGRVIAEGQPDEPTRVGDGVTLHDGSVVFRSTIGDGAVIGERSAVVGTDLAPGTVVPDRTVVLNGEVFGTVEW
jgi:carbonic anhydrase/acetyltransferase-like protein (isoleucine patch superfamily)